MSKHTQLIHEYACIVQDGDKDYLPDDGGRNSYAGASPAMMRRRQVYLDSANLASQAMVWCDVRRIAYDTAAEAIAVQRAAIGK